MRKRGRSFTRRVDPNAAFHAVAMQHGLDVTQQNDLGVALRVSLEALRIGRGTEQEFHTLAAAVNVSLILCERDVGAEHIGIVYAVQEALMEIKARHARTGKWGFSGPEMQAINDAATLHEQQIASVPRVACRDALFEARRRAAQGHILERVPA